MLLPFQALITMDEYSCASLFPHALILKLYCKANKHALLVVVDGLCEIYRRIGEGVNKIGMKKSLNCCAN